MNHGICLRHHCGETDQLKSVENREMNGRKVYVISRACYIVQTETNHIAAYLKSNGYELVDTCQEADAVVITTCAVTALNSDANYQAILDCINTRNDGVPVYVVGCYSRIEPQRVEELKSYGNVIAIPEIRDIEHEFLGTNSWDSIVYNNFFSHPFYNERMKEANSLIPLKHRLMRHVLSNFDSIANREMMFYYFFHVAHLYSPEIQRRIWPVIASKGCTHACTYCAVRIGRGKYCSKPMDSILNEIRTGVSKGYKRVLLIGDELGPYGVDLKNGTSLAKLLEALNSDEYPVSIGLWYIDCFHLLAAAPMIEELCKKKKVFFLGITVQSGSPNILKMMNRRYSLEDNIEAIRKFRQYPDVIIATQIMVGFPGETDEDFQQSMSVIENGYFDLVEVFEYSPRPGTKAATMIDNVPARTKNERAVKLRKLAAKKGKKLFVKHLTRELAGKA
jgi:tRNA A37 methylthiotransferase MiaB